MKEKGGEAKVSFNPGDFTAEHMSMEVAPQWDPQEGWFRKDVVQPMEAWAEFTPYLASVTTTWPFEQSGVEFADPSAIRPRHRRCYICIWWWEVSL